MARDLPNIGHEKVRQPTAGPVHLTRARSAEAGRQVGQRVARYAGEAGLEVQVVTRGRAGGADPADHLAAGDVLAGAHEDSRLVAVAGREVLAGELAVVDAGVLAVPAVP